MRQIKALLASIYGINAYRNKYSRNEPKLSSTHASVQNKPKEPINTPIAPMDLSIDIYD
jgi:hypothetical protein